MGLKVCCGRALASLYANVGRQSQKAPMTMAHTLFWRLGFSVNAKPASQLAEKSCSENFPINCCRICFGVPLEVKNCCEKSLPLPAILTLPSFPSAAAESGTHQHHEIRLSVWRQVTDIAIPLRAEKLTSFRCHLRHWKGRHW